MQGLNGGLLLICLLVSFSVDAQRCRYEVNRVDARTELIIKRTIPVEMTMVNQQPLLIKAQSIGGNKYLKVRYYMYNGFTINELFPMIFQFADSSTLELFPRSMPASGSKNKGFVKVSSLLIFDINEEQFQILSSKRVRGVGFEIESLGQQFYDVRKRQQNDIQYILRCVDNQ